MRATLRVVSRVPKRLTKTGASRPAGTRGESFAHGKPFLECANRVRANRREPFAFAFAADANDAGLEIEVAVGEADQLAHAQAGRVERFEDRPIAECRRLVALRRGEQLAHFVGREQVGQLVRLPRVAERLARVRLEPALRAGRSEKSSARTPAGARSTTWRSRPHAARRRSRAARPTVMLAGSGQLPSSSARYSASADEVLAVALERVVRRAALDAHVLQEAADFFAHGRVGVRVES